MSVESQEDPGRPRLRPVQRTAAYGVITDAHGAVLLLRVPGGRDQEGRWSLPGGTVRHGEHPRDRVAAGLLEQTGLRAATITPLDAGADTVDLPGHGISVHTLRLIFAVTVHGGLPTSVRTPGVEPSGVGTSGVEPSGVGTQGTAGPDAPAEGEPGLPDRLPGEDRAVAPSSGDDVLHLASQRLPDGRAVPEDRPVAQFIGRFTPTSELAALPLAPFVAGMLAGRSWRVDVSSRTVTGDIDLLDPPMDGSMPPGPDVTGPDVTGADVTGADVTGADGDRVEVPVFVQRPAAYAVLVDEDAEDGPAMLLSRFAGSGNTWTLPGGGIDHGEHPLLALRREIHEEAGLPYAPGPLIDISSRHFVGRGPLGRLEDFHALRLIYAGSVPTDTEPQVVEVNGSTDLAAWITITQFGRAGAVPTVRDALATWRSHRRGAGTTTMDDAADARGDEMIPPSGERSGSGSGSGEGSGNGDGSPGGSAA